MENNTNQSMFDLFGGNDKKDVRWRLNKNEAQLYIKPGNRDANYYVFILNSQDSEVIKSLGYERVNIERNNYTGEIYIVFNNEIGWSCAINKGSIRIQQSGFIKCLQSCLNSRPYADMPNVTDNGKWRITMGETLVDGVFVIKKVEA